MWALSLQRSFMVVRLPQYVSLYQHCIETIQQAIHNFVEMHRERTMKQDLETERIVDRYCVLFRLVAFHSFCICSRGGIGVSLYPKLPSYRQQSIMATNCLEVNNPGVIKTLWALILDINNDYNYILKDKYDSTSSIC